MVDIFGAVEEGDVGALRVRYDDLDCEAPDATASSSVQFNRDDEEEAKD
jgi:hypothetical protein